jgi:hypothetical protein
MTREPVLTFLAGANGVVVAGLAVANALSWLSLSGEQIAAVSAFVVAVTTLAAAMIRRQVTPVAQAEAKAMDAYMEGLFQPVPGSGGTFGARKGGES